MVAVFVIAAVAVLAALVALHWYGWRRLVRDTTAAGSVPRRIGTAVFIAGPALLVAAPGSGRAGAPFRVQQVVSWPGYLWMAFFIYVSLALIVGEGARPLLRRFLERRDARRADDTGAVTVPAAAEAEPVPVPAAEPYPAPAPAAPVPSPSRRLFVSRVVGGAAVAAAVATVGAGAYNVLSGPAVKRVTVPLARLPRRAHGFRIAVVSDIHLGPVLGRGHTQRIVDTINATGPDLVAVVGDLVDGTVADLGPAAEPLAQLKARHGSFFVTGNHEYISDAAEEWVDHVRELGLHPLENARVPIGDFDLAGVNDVSGESQDQGPDYDKALGDRDTSRASVLLAHQPVMIHDAVKHGVDLQLSGHTHGGQMWPGNIIADLANPTLAGLERYGDTQLYVTRGAGAWGPPVRVGAPSDITVVTLASRQA
ncbi:metallophosphoesterase [Streptomyces triticagri]|uniref:Metallophosphoesterase n=1 Tax=Streptomyces triticagri TaxID=2293568 RepID=A0A372MA56_9ACTN|nr:metallophosphoesterase [Streptomyces triticagri]RFU87480.1 metallophosphoesterase [Streptomyces triticagri]